MLLYKVQKGETIMAETILRMYGIQKYFPGVHALDDARLEVKAGEVMALVGENGAGKSTLMSVLFGLYQPEKGVIKKILTLPTAKAGGFLLQPLLHWMIPCGISMSYTVSTSYIYTVPACPAVQFSYLYADCSCSPFFKILMPAFVSRS